MEIKKLSKIFTLLLLCGMSVFVLGFTKDTQAVKIDLSKSKPKNLTYFEFYDQNGARIDVSGFGNGSSGTITNYLGKEYLGTFNGAGTVSGTYSISGGICSINVTYTPSGESSQLYQGNAAFSDTPFVH
ncbi:hypothetical protein [Mucilaginibacter lappiensis]|uniref:Uncharacterized protein n=1 Tax=Mucilaginibacter lappiensis TaxID=354630 RepID=A0A841JMD5_9SPHI|nr:hypothetical protein [Mucilaginibacter lappiensis]MBB6129898.1 hypothetical protein [Mucilaginibacter lappiensis]